MAYPVTLNGRTYTLADFEGQNYAAGFPDALQDFVTDAGTSVTAAAASATAAAASETAAAASAAAAAASVDAIEGFYLGAQASNPTVDLNGAPVTVGDFYFNTATNQTRIYDGSSWNVIAPDLVGDASPQLGGTLDFNGNIATSFESTGIDDNATSTAITIDASERVGIGIVPDAPLTVFGGGVAEFRVGNFGPTSNSAIRISRNDSTVSSGNPLGYLEFGSNDATGSTDTAFAYVSAEAEGTFGAGDNPTALTFGVTADGTSSPFEAMRINNNGTVTIGTPSQSTHELAVREATSPRITIDDTGGTSTSVNAGLLLRYDTTNAGHLTFAGDNNLLLSNLTAGDIIYETGAEHSFTVGGVEELRITNTETSVFGTSGDIFTLVDTNLTASGSNIGNVRIAFDDSAGTRVAYVGTANTSDFFVNNQYGSTKLTYAGSTKITTVNEGINVTGSIGVGMTPTKEIEVSLDDTTTTTLGQKGGIQLYSPSATVGNGGEITWSSGSGNTETWCAISGHITSNSATGSVGDLVFATKAAQADTTPTERARIDSSGRLLVGCITSNGSYISSNHTQINIQGQASGAIGSLMLRSQGTTNATAFELAASDGVAASYLWNGSDSAMVFGTNNTERMRILSTGGITFNGETTAAHALDDYEEGTYTVELYDAGSGGNQSSSTVTGYYTKIGRVVTVNIYAFNNIDTTGMTAANVLYFTLPLTSGSTGRHVGQINHHGFTYVGNTNYQNIMPQVTQSVSRGYFVANGYGVGDATVKVSDISSGADDIVTMSITYHV